jgi:two-component system sensor histidine kinase BaeS
MKTIRIGITHRLFLSILGAACLALVSMFLMMQWSLHSGFLRYLNGMDRARLERLSQKLEPAYAEHGGWEFLREDPISWIDSVLQPEIPDGVSEQQGRDRDSAPPPPPLPEYRPRWEGIGPFPPPPPGERFGGHGPHFVILDENRKPIFGGPPGESVSLRPIVHNGTIIGYVGLRIPPKHLLDPPQLQFLREQKSILIAAGLGLTIAVALFAVPLAKRLLRPIKALAAATQEIASGKDSVRVPVSSSDELGQLARAFNGMAATLEQNKKARRQWVADISHELRTPLAIVIGEIEALLEGVRKSTPEAVRSLHAEALRLHRLVEDLYQLALSDVGSLNYYKEVFDPVDVLEDALDTLLEQFAAKGITVKRDFSEDLGKMVLADWQRLRQLFINLLDNSLKYTDPGGALAARLSCDGGRIILELADSAPGVADEHLERLFERLYRVEGSRSRATGGAGLGLAICKSIVEAHGGTISAHPSSLGGILIRVTLPLASRQP